MCLRLNLLKTGLRNDGIIQYLNENYLLIANYIIFSINITNSFLYIFNTINGEKYI